MSFWPRLSLRACLSSCASSEVSSVASGPSISSSIQACTFCSNSASGSFHVVCTAASRIALSAYPCRRPRSSSVMVPSTGQTPKMFCHRNKPVAGSGGDRRCSHARTYCAHSDGTCDSTPIRARTSSPRLVSCVVNAAIAHRGSDDGERFGQIRPRPDGFGERDGQHQRQVLIVRAVHVYPTE